MKTHRSPAAPSRSLETCFQLTKEIYDAYGHAAITKEDIGHALGVAAAGGSFGGLMASLNQFGLLQKEGAGLYTISQAAKDYFAIPSDCPMKRNLARQDFIERVDFFTSLMKDLNGRIPTPKNLETLLMSRYGFNKPKAAITAKVFYESLTWAEKIDQKGNVLSKIASTNSEPVEEEEELDATAITAEKSDSSLSATCVADSGNLRTQISLGEGRVLEISYPKNLTKKDAARVFALLKPICIDWDPEAD